MDDIVQQIAAITRDFFNPMLSTVRPAGICIIPYTNKNMVVLNNENWNKVSSKSSIIGFRYVPITVRRKNSYKKNKAHIHF